MCGGPTARYLLDLLGVLPKEEEEDDDESKMDDTKAMTMTMRKQRKK